MIKKNNNDGLSGKKKKNKALELLGLAPNNLKKNQYHLSNMDQESNKEKSKSKTNLNLLAAPKKVRPHRVRSISQSDLPPMIHNKPSLQHKRSTSDQSGNWNNIKLTLNQSHSAHLRHNSVDANSIPTLSPQKSDDIQIVIQGHKRKDSNINTPDEHEQKYEESLSVDMDEHKQDIEQFAMQITNS